jgi:hypothetical protein
MTGMGGSFPFSGRPLRGSRDAANPAEATKPGRIRSAAVIAVPEAFKPSPANDWTE